MSSKSRRRKWLRVCFGLLLAPVSLWCLVLSLAPTDWARTRIVHALSESTKQPAGLESVQMRLLGGVSLHGLALGDTKASDRAWLTADRIDVDISLWHLLKGRVQATLGRAQGVSLRVHRLPDGSFEFGDLLTRGPDPAPGSSASAEQEDVPLKVEIENAKLTILDDPTRTSVQITNVYATGLWGRDRAEITRLAGLTQGGRLRLGARLDRGTHEPAFESEVRLQNVALGPDIGALGFLVPALAGQARSLSGRLNLDVRAQARCSSAEQVKKTLSGQGSVAITELSAGSSELLVELCQALRLPLRNRYASLQGGFLIGNQRVATRDLSLRIDPLPSAVSIVGWTDFAGRVDYLIRVDGLTNRLGELAGRLSPETQSYLGDLPQALSEVAELRVRGTTRNLEVTANGAKIEDWADKWKKEHPEDMDALRELGQHLRGRLLR